jgi:hypothetical protein
MGQRPHEPSDDVMDDQPDQPASAHGSRRGFGLFCSSRFTGPAPPLLPRPHQLGETQGSTKPEIERIEMFRAQRMAWRRSEVAASMILAGSVGHSLSGPGWSRSGRHVVATRRRNAPVVKDSRAC